MRYAVLGALHLQARLEAERVDRVRDGFEAVRKLFRVGDLPAVRRAVCERPAVVGVNVDILEEVCRIDY